MKRLKIDSVLAKTFTAPCIKGGEPWSASISVVDLINEHDPVKRKLVADRSLFMGQLKKEIASHGALLAVETSVDSPSTITPMPSNEAIATPFPSRDDMEQRRPPTWMNRPLVTDVRSDIQSSKLDQLRASRLRMLQQSTGSSASHHFTNIYPLSVRTIQRSASRIHDQASQVPLELTADDLLEAASDDLPIDFGSCDGDDLDEQPDQINQLQALLDEKNTEGAANVAVEVRVDGEMRVAMDTGIRLNPTLSAMYADADGAAGRVAERDQFPIDDNCIGIVQARDGKKAICLRVKPDLASKFRPTPIRNGEHVRVIGAIKSGGVNFLFVSPFTSSGSITGFIMEQDVNLMDVAPSRHRDVDDASSTVAPLNKPVVPTFSNHGAIASPSIEASGTVAFVPPIEVESPAINKAMADISNDLPSADEMQMYAEYLEIFHEHSDQTPEFALGACCC